LNAVVLALLVKVEFVSPTVKKSMLSFKLLNASIDFLHYLTYDNVFRAEVKNIKNTASLTIFRDFFSFDS
jgi:hypothetical protein